MKYIVVWPAAKFLTGGKRVVVTKGNSVPAGVDEEMLHELVLAGAIVAASPPPVSVSVAAIVDPVDPGEVVRPAKNARADDWRAYAEMIGVDSSLTKAEIIEAVETLEAGNTDPGDDDGNENAGAGDADPADPDAPTIR